MRAGGDGILKPKHRWRRLRVVRRRRLRSVASRQGARRPPCCDCCSARSQIGPDAGERRREGGRRAPLATRYSGDVRFSASRLWRANGARAATESEFDDRRVAARPTMDAWACLPLRQRRHPLPRFLPPSADEIGARGRSGAVTQTTNAQPSAALSASNNAADGFQIEAIILRSGAAAGAVPRRSDSTWVSLKMPFGIGRAPRPAWLCKRRDAEAVAGRCGVAT
jgi:hypothetical protein